MRENAYKLFHLSLQNWIQELLIFIANFAIIFECAYLDRLNLILNSILNNFCICRIYYDFIRLNLLRNAVSFKQITNCIKLLTTSLEIHSLQNKLAGEMKITKKAVLESIST